MLLSTLYTNQKEEEEGKLLVVNGISLRERERYTFKLLEGKSL
jgi:hypothetical protein